MESNFVFVGREDATKFRDNLERIIKLIGKDVHIILINGVDIDVSKWIGEDRVQRNREMNGVVDDIVNNFDNVDLVDMRLIVNDEKLLVNKDNRHFDRYVYYILAKRLSELCDEKMLKTSGFVRIEMKRFFFKVINKITRGLKLFLI